MKNKFDILNEVTLKYTSQLWAEFVVHDGLLNPIVFDIIFDVMEEYAEEKEKSKKMKTTQTPEEFIEAFLRHEASQFPMGTDEEMLYRFRNQILAMEKEL